MRAFFLLIGIAASCVVLSGCSPKVDAEFQNATGQPIVVTNRGEPAFHVAIPAGASAALDIFVSRSPHRPDFSVSSAGRVWVYHSETLTRLGWDYWERRPLEAKRLHVSVDSRGRIYLLSTSGAFIAQPSGFPIHPDEQKKT
jgi:hypothetical protein